MKSDCLIYLIKDVPYTYYAINKLLHTPIICMIVFSACYFDMKI